MNEELAKIIIQSLVSRIEMAVGQLQCNQSLVAMNTLKAAIIEVEKHFKIERN